MRSVLRNITLASCLLAGVACSASNPARPHVDPNVILRDEITAGSYRNAYDVVRALRPNWLVKRSAKTSASIWVYVDGSKYGDISWLKNVPGSSIGSIQRIDAGTATMRWGIGHSEGALAVSTYVRN